MIERNESMTAKLCQWVRANHSLCTKDKIFDDFLAYRLMGHKEYKETKTVIQNSCSLNFINEYVCPVVLPRIVYAENRLCRYFDINKIAQPSFLDGLHYDETAHKIIADKLTQYIMEIEK